MKTGHAQSQASEAPVVWGILSTARINDLALEAIAGSPDLECAAVASRSSARAEGYAKRNGIARAYGSYQTLLEDPEVEAVYIPLPNSLHTSWSIRALQAGKHVLCEKPLSSRPADVSATFDAAERANRLMAEAFMYRFHPQAKRILEVLATGAIGDLAHIRATLTFPMDNQENDPRSSKQLDGGALMDVGCYCVSGARLLAGEPEWVYGEQVTDGMPVDMRFVGTMRFPADVTAQFDAALTLPPRDDLEIVGSEGSLLVADPWHCRRSSFQLLRRGRVEQVAVDPDGVYGLRHDPVEPYRLQFEAMSRAIRGAGELEYGRRDALHQARAIAALQRSAHEGHPVWVDANLENEPRESLAS